MVTTYRRDNNNYKSRNSKNHGLKMTRIIVPVLAIMILSMVVFFQILGEAQCHTDKEQHVTSVYIEKGDSLWSIASKYYTSECGSMKTYIQEIYTTNNLTSESIHEGNYLLIPYYE